MKSDTLRTLPFEPDRFLNDEHVAKMSAAQRGIYISALCWEWLEGDLPDDPVALAFLLRLKARDVVRDWPVVRRRFEARENGRLYHERLESDRVKAAERLARFRESGSRGGRAKAAKSDVADDDDMAGHPLGTLEPALKAPSSIKQATISSISSNNSKAGGAAAVADEITEKLTSEGIARHVAVELVSAFGPEAVRQQLEWHRSRRRLKDKAGSLVIAIRESWPKPRHLVSLGADLLNDPRFGPSPSDNVQVAS